MLVLFSCSVKSLQPLGLQHAKFPCPTFPGVCSIHVHLVDDVIPPSHPLSSSSPPAFNLSQQGLNPKLLQCRQILYCLSHQESPEKGISSVQFSSVAQSCPTLCDPMNRSTPGLPVHHQLPEFTQTHVHQISDAIQTSHPLSSSSPPSPNPSQHRILFKRVNSSHEVAKGLEFQL